MNLGKHAEILLWLSVFLSLHSLQLVLTKPYRGRYIESKCTDAPSGREMLIGDAFTRPGQCVRVQCLGNLSIWEDRCQTPELTGNCTRIPAANEYLDYPKCCPLYECKTYEMNENGETEETRTYDHYGTLKKTHITQVFVVPKPLEGNLPGTGLRTQFDI